MAVAVEAALNHAASVRTSLNLAISPALARRCGRRSTVEPVWRHVLAAGVMVAADRDRRNVRNPCVGHRPHLCGRHASLRRDPDEPSSELLADSTRLGRGQPAHSGNALASHQARDGRDGQAELVGDEAARPALAVMAGA
jgi:hypothetical protein